MNLFSEKKFISSRTGRELKYLCYSPNNDGNLPLIIYLHGAGSRGTELSQLSHASLKRAEIYRREWLPLSAAATRGLSFLKHL